MDLEEILQHYKNILNSLENIKDVSKDIKNIYHMDINSHKKEIFPFA